MPRREQGENVLVSEWLPPLDVSKERLLRVERVARAM